VYVKMVKMAAMLCGSTEDKTSQAVMYAICWQSFAHNFVTARAMLACLKSRNSVCPSVTHVLCD